MRRQFDIRRPIALCLTLLLAGAPGSARPQEKSAAEGQLRSEVEVLKEQLRRIEQQMTQQEERIRKLSGERPPAPAPAPPAPAQAATCDSTASGAEKSIAAS